MDAAADSTTDIPTTECTHQSAVPMYYPSEGSLERKDTKRLIATEEFTLSTPKSKTNQSTKESTLAPAANKNQSLLFYI